MLLKFFNVYESIFTNQIIVNIKDFFKKDQFDKKLEKNDNIF